MACRARRSFHPARAEAFHLIDLRAVTLARDNLKIAAVGAIDAETLASHLDDILANCPIRPVSFRSRPPLSRCRHAACRPIDVPQSTIRFGREG